MTMQTIADTKMVTQMQTLAPDAAAATRQAKLKDASEKFEGMMLQELLKPLERAGSAGGGGFDGEEEGAGSDGAGFSDSAISSYSSYGVEAMATALSKSGGLGIAKEVMRQIGKSDEMVKEQASSTKV